MKYYNINFKKLSLQTLLLGTLVSCATGKQQSAEVSIRNQDADKVVVQKLSNNIAVVSPIDNDKWLSLRETNDESIKFIQSLLATGKGLEAEKSARIYLEKKPGDLEGMIALASALALSRQFDLAAFYAKLIEGKMPNNPISQNLKAISILVSAKNIADYRKAENLLRSAFEGSSSEIAAGLNLGSLYLDLGNTQSSYDIYSKGLSRCADCYPTLMGHGIAARRLKKSAEAIDSFNKILKKDELEPRALYQLALVYKNNTNEANKAILSLEKILNNDRANDTLNEHAQTLLRAIKGESREDKKEEMDAEIKAAEDAEKNPKKPEEGEAEPVTDEELKEITIDEDPEDFTIE